ncbi:MAG: PKD domain-containing protein [Methanoregulaceae archaeon]
MKRLALPELVVLVLAVAFLGYPVVADDTNSTAVTTTETTAAATTVATTGTTVTPTATTLATIETTVTPTATTVTTTETTATATTAVATTATTSVSIPVSYFYADVTSGTVSLTVQFTDSSTNTPTAWYWSFGDGSYSSSQNPSHTYTSAGTYTVALTATNSAGSNTLTRTSYITVSSGSPVASFYANDTYGVVPLSVLFTDTSTNSPTSWYWEFGDGNVSTSQDPVYTYVFNGTFTVTLIAINSVGSNVSTITDYITVYADEPVASFTVNDTYGYNPLTVQFNDTSSNYPTSWYWEFGDGYSSYVQNPVHTYTTAGTYTVTFECLNSEGSDSTEEDDYITVIASSGPSASFSASKTSGTAPLTIQFTDTSSGDPTSWYWTFGDGSTSTSENPSHTYTEAGSYTVKLLVTNSAGSDTVSQSNFVVAAASATTTAANTATIPVASFSADVTSGTNPLTVQFTDTSSNSPAYWYWSFGDGTHSSSQNPSHTFSEAGTYSITMKATNTGGSNSVTRTNYITVTQPTAVPTTQESPLSPFATIGAIGSAALAGIGGFRRNKAR